MTTRGLSSGHDRRPSVPRVGLYGILGKGNIGNDASMESLLNYLRDQHPDAVIDAMCAGPEYLKEHYGIDAIQWQWQEQHQEGLPRARKAAIKALGKCVDLFRTAAWVRRHDIVLVPGAGVLEASLPVGPFTVPYAMFLLCGAGRIFGTKVALVNVGADAIKPRLTRWLSNSAARLATFRSYRDNLSLKAMEDRGVDVSNDHVYADLVYGIPTPNLDAGDPLTVGVGVMDYYGTNNDRDRAIELHASYVHNMKVFVRWLVDTGHKVKLLVGDVTWDYEVVEAILDDLREQRPTLEDGSVVAEPITTFAELTQAIAGVSSVVAIRYHNVICGLKLSRPTISISYSKKHDILMADMGLSDFCQHPNELDVDRLIEQFIELEGRSGTVRGMLEERTTTKALLVQQLFDALSKSLFSAPGPGPTADTASQMLEPATH